jgi:23S rRNA (guanine2445-N2)-methyltransferase / 23S rRNA (guanine2069-N7)-methyltransferase
VLNLFCYTGAASVQAALGGARQTVSVDLSNTYLHWAGRNLRLNGFDVGELAAAAPATRAVGDPWRAAGGARRRADPPAAAHLTARADGMAWLRAAAEDPERRFDLVFCDPPTFSNSKKLEGVFDVERDHPELIRLAMAVLAPGGTLYFSTNKRRFKLDPAAVDGLACEDITAQTLDEDFRRPPPAHRAWRIRHAADRAEGRNPVSKSLACPAG